MEQRGNLILNDELVFDEETTIIGIDPGKNGGVTILNIIDYTEQVEVFRCPKTPDEMAKQLAESVPYNGNRYNMTCFMEHVHAFPGQGVVSTFSFGQNLGQWEGILASQDIPVEYVAPRKWMDIYNTPSKLTRRMRKRYLREQAEIIFPNVKMTFNISDSLLIANYGKQTLLERKGKVDE
tara:strand:+ start:9209 stop:9748 length:540 start_codon:yes stop_codon:yes gene_type:complete